MGNLLSNPAFLILIGFLAGASVILVLWIVLNNNRKKKEEELKEERNEIIGVIGEDCADIDSMLTSFRTGMMEVDDFKQKIAQKMEVINRSLKTNMPVLDMYYAKYIEALLREYEEKEQELTAPPPPPPVESYVQPEQQYGPTDQQYAGDNQQQYAPDDQQSEWQYNFEGDEQQQGYYQNYQQQGQFPGNEQMGYWQEPTAENAQQPQYDEQQSPFAPMDDTTDQYIQQFDPNERDDDSMRIEDPQSKTVISPDEEFSMETIMDLDVSSLRLDEYMDEGDKKSKSQDKDKDKTKKQPAQNTQQEKNTKGKGNKKDVSITGEDVADKIDSFFKFE